MIHVLKRACLSFNTRSKRENFKTSGIVFGHDLRHATSGQKFEVLGDKGRAKIFKFKCVKSCGAVLNWNQLLNHMRSVHVVLEEYYKVDIKNPSDAVEDPILEAGNDRKQFIWTEEAFR